MKSEVDTPESACRHLPLQVGGLLLRACAALSIMQSAHAEGQNMTVANNLPRVVIPTSSAYTPVRPVNPSAGTLYPWRQNITATVFWIGELPCENNPTPNDKSSWDVKWQDNYGGYDNPEPTARVADFRTGDFRPRNFNPKLNPFYIALPYNDIISSSSHKTEAAKVIPWFARFNPAPGKTVCKGRWVQIYFNGRSCYAQWEDCGPWVTDDWEYVFQGKQPKNTSNQSAGIDVSPAIRDYLDLQSGKKCHWRFVEDAQVPYGPWKRYGAATLASNSASYATQGASGTDLDAQRRYLEYLRKLRDEQYLRKTTPY